MEVVLRGKSAEHIHMAVWFRKGWADNKTYMFSEIWLFGFQIKTDKPVHGFCLSLSYRHSVIHVVFCGDNIINRGAVSPRLPIRLFKTVFDSVERFSIEFAHLWDARWKLIWHRLKRVRKRSYNKVGQITLDGWLSEWIKWWCVWLQSGHAIGTGTRYTISIVALESL